MGAMRIPSAMTLRTPFFRRAHHFCKNKRHCRIPCTYRRLKAPLDYSAAPFGVLLHQLRRQVARESCLNLIPSSMRTICYGRINNRTRVHHHPMSRTKTLHNGTPSLQMDPLRRLYSTDALARVLLDHGTKQNGVNRGATVTVETLLHVLAVEEKTVVNRRRLTRMLRSLMNAGWGRLVLGRYGHVTRFIWPTSLVSFRGDAASAQPVNTNPQSTSPPVGDDRPGSATGSGHWAWAGYVFTHLSAPGEAVHFDNASGRSDRAGSGAFGAIYTILTAQGRLTGWRNSR